MASASACIRCSGLPSLPAFASYPSNRRARWPFVQLRKAGKSLSWRFEEGEDRELGSPLHTFDKAAHLFNAREYYECHDILESLWNDAHEPQRSLLHGLLQCTVALYHLLSQNHHGAMVELGEGLNKLRRLRLINGPFADFEKEASSVLEFLYNTQLENAACSDDMCITMDGSDQSYRLLGNFGAGESLYVLIQDQKNIVYILFSPERVSNLVLASTSMQTRVKLPILRASEEDLYRIP